MIAADPTADDVVSALELVAQYGIPDALAARLLDVGTNAFIDYIADEVFDGFILRGAATCRFFEAPYGHGKTHLMMLLEGLAHKHRMAVATTDLSNELGLANWKGITQHVLAT